MTDEASPRSGEEDEAVGRRLPVPTASEAVGGPAAGLTRRRRRGILVSALGALVLLAAGGGVAVWLQRVPASSHGSLQLARGVELMPPAQQAAGRLMSVSAESATSAWAVGVSCELCGISAAVGGPLIMHWDGTTWSRVRSPALSGSAFLAGVSSGPVGSAWAVGYDCPSDCSSSITGARTLILRWDGTAWSRVPSPSPGPSSGFAFLDAVASGPGDSAWAVGDYCASGCGTSSTHDVPLILHWDGARWSQVPGPSLGTDDGLDAVSAGPTRTAWAVGWYCPSRCSSNDAPAGERTLTLRWDGTAWSHVASPRPGAAEVLDGVDLGPDGSAWATGWSCSSGCGASSEDDQTLTLHWDGTAWSEVTSPNPGAGGFLGGASQGRAGSAYTVGYYCKCRASSEQDVSLILRWDGDAWSQITSPSPGGPAQLSAISSDPAGSIWAAGYYCTSACGTNLETDQTLLVHWATPGHTG